TADLARLMEDVPLAIRWIDEARKLDPADRDSAEIAARLYLARLADLLGAERLDAARARMAEVDAFYDDATTRWKEKPLELTRGDAYLIYGRGLYNQGEVVDARTMLEKAKTLGKAQAAEEIATMAMKTGKYEEAAAGYEAVAQQARSTPIETTFERARLMRLAGEAWAAAGKTDKAKAAWKQPVRDWDDVLGASSLPPRARAEAFTEAARLAYDLGDVKQSLKAFAAAVDANPDETQVYADAISYLVTRGHYDDALDAYHRALGRNGITDYMKVYAS